MGRLRRSIALAIGFSALALLSCTFPAGAQPSPPEQQSASLPRATGSGPGPLTFRVTAREVVVDVIAVDRRNHPVPDLKPSDLEVSSQPVRTRGREAPPSSSGQITSWHIVDPASAAPAAGISQQAGLAVTTSCLNRVSIHYQLTWRPDAQGLTPGDHEMLVRTTRRGVHLYYRHSYYIGATEPLEANRPDKLSAPKLAQLASQLHEDACYQLKPPPSIALHASLIETGLSNTVRYSVTVDATSLSYISLSEQGRRVQVDYAVCNFNQDGQPVSYFTASVDTTLNPVDYARALSLGFPHILQFPKPANLGLSRFVIRDLVTGNTGSVDVIYPFANRQEPDAAQLMALRRADVKEAIQRYKVEFLPPQGPIGSFGSIIPEANAFCGDVYEIPGDTPKLPDYREMDPIASLYTHSLAVPDQIFVGTACLPGVTTRVAWFGIDYHGTFYIRAPGIYQFKMVSDDGAILQIDDRRVINLDGAHMARMASGAIKLDSGWQTIHVPYFQGPVDAVALQLWVKPPKEDWKIFDLRDFAPPAGDAAPGPGRNGEGARR